MKTLSRRDRSLLSSLRSATKGPAVLPCPKTAIAPLNGSYQTNRALNAEERPPSGRALVTLAVQKGQVRLAGIYSKRAKPIRFGHSQGDFLLSYRETHSEFSSTVTAQKGENSAASWPSQFPESALSIHRNSPREPAESASCRQNAAAKASAWTLPR